MGLKRICIAIRSFERPLMGNNFLGPYARRIGLPESRVLYTVLRSPHIDKKSREQFEMVIKKQLVVLKTKTNEELRKKLFWLKRLRIVGAQYEVLFDSETRLDKGKLKAVLEQCHTTGPLEP